MPGRGPKKRGRGGDPAEHLRLLTKLLPAEAAADNDTWLPAPLDPAVLFPEPAPIELEVGCGKGLFLASAAAARSISAKRSVSKSTSGSTISSPISSSIGGGPSAGI